MQDNRVNFKRAFKIRTKNNSYSEDTYIVIANTFAEAEKVYWEELNGYHEIIAIESFPDVKGVGGVLKN